MSAERRQFLVLYRTFLLRVVDLESSSSDADPNRLLAQLAAVLAGVGYLLTFWLIFMNGRFTRRDLLTMEHLLIATTMVVTGLFSVLCWNSIFPDKRDVLVLAPLPVRTSTMFQAKLYALIAAMSLSIGSLNIFSGLVWPFHFASTNGGGFPGIIRSLIAYWTTMMLAGVFMFCSVLGLQGVVSQLLPRRQFLRLAALIQVAAFFLFVGVYILEPSLEDPMALAAPGNHRLLACLPSYWFLGLFQQLNGSMMPQFVPLVRWAWIGLSVAIFVGMASVFLVYFRTMGKIVEQPDIVAEAHRVNWSPRFGTLLETCIALFSLRTMLRSKQHRVLLSFYLGTGLALALAYVEAALHGFLHGARGDAIDPSFLAASLWVMCFVVLGVRFVITMPHTLRANWIFRLIEIRNVPVYVSAVRRSLLMLAVAPVWLFLSVLFLARWPTWAVVGHLVVLGLVGVIVTDLCLFGFYKLPFTCSYLPGRSKVQFIFWGFLLLLLPPSIVRLEGRVLHQPFDWIGMIALFISLAAFAWWRTATPARSAEKLIFEEEYPPELFSLGLDRIDRNV
jgi:hypothetical protein